MKIAVEMMASVVILAVMITCLQADFSKPIPPANYQGKIKQGFSTNYFKGAKPWQKYKKQNIADVYDAGFRNLRLRSRADLHYPNSTSWSQFLNTLEQVVDDCLEKGVIPIISWIHHEDEANSTDEARGRYVTWWTAVATRLKDKDYRLSFNLFTELGYTGCGSDGKGVCQNSLRLNSSKYNEWTSKVVDAIRGTLGKNKKRILILGSPGKTAGDLDKIEKRIYENDNYTMAEWHLYASGPNKKNGSQKHWSGTGSEKDKQNVKDAINEATTYTNSTGILTYLGAWMPWDNKNGELTEDEVISFGTYFVKQLKKNNIPWSMNVLDIFYDTRNSEWIKTNQTIKGQTLNMWRVLKKIERAM